MKKWIVRFLVLVIAAFAIYYFIPDNELPINVKIDKLVVTKSRRIMEAYSNGKVIKIYTISLGRNPLGDKEFEGDKRTPEGSYTINDKNPKSGYYKNLGVSYPNKDDINEANKNGLKPGGEIKIHGIRNGLGFIGKFHRFFDWTAGCIALTDKEVDELYDHVIIGTPIIINP